MNRKKLMVILYLLVAIVGVACLAKVVLDKPSQSVITQEKEEQVGREQESLDTQDIEYEGHVYGYNYNITNILFIGVDNAGEVQEYEEGHAGQSDTLILLSMNSETESTTIIEISRDSMVEVEIYNRNNKFVGKERMQIAAQFAYGDGKEGSCYLTSKAVSSLLWNIPIDAYIAVNVDGIAEITEAMGGVQITVPKDYTHIEPEFTEGANLLLKGEVAERYVRYRDTKTTGSNSERMERQTQFLEALALQLSEKDSSWYDEILEESKEYITTDFDLKKLNKVE